ncbi:hypothetical protein CTEN210_15029 [Chaetoceros tenuissimus]|uniref:Uncharacterized protein n=1 Tax=Chaetoceros tenuissimus TaxID=426638 RepID=A0AAD3D686_9STRA|nr:hypothetical protein CTEN210_15029 [Chaetoceros tenuissimus]
MMSSCRVIARRRVAYISKFSSSVRCTSRYLSSSSGDEKNGLGLDSLDASSKWRKGQLSKIEDRFKNDSSIKKIDDWPVYEPLDINNDEDVQPMWKDMESRVTRRKSMTISEASSRGKKVGRSNIRKTDEEAWLSAGLYDDEKPKEQK